MRTYLARNRVLAALSLLGFFASWAVLVEEGWIPRLRLPSPFQVVAAVSQIGAPLFLHSAATTARAVLGFSIGSALGILLGLIGHHSPVLRAILFPHINAWRPVPPVAMIPFFILWLGFTETSRLLLVVTGCALVIAVDTLHACRNVDTRFVDAARSLGASKRRVVTTVVLPAIWPLLAGPLSVALGLSITLVVVSEFMGADFGLGYLLNTARVTRSLAVVLLVSALLGAIGFLLELSLKWFCRRACAWAFPLHERDFNQ